ncbi:Acyl-CoA thioesterase [Microbulbifer donghaiensis]|uniref:Acyl-CoA thioesterase n=1 Tax=Microbulbifer donghaiensis TaxID=494016 RepID=A0A1M4YM18_9GAMM|nr:thioesterase family protein [Microbulbifer donghaiensis]SHF06693.1 Acyl-CoA thioesterase [Microbulbifer donghaiensis]
MTFDQLLAEWRSYESAQQVPAGWTQGRATFGGLVAAMLYEKMAAHVDADASLRSLTISFVGPVGAGPIEISSNTLRAGRSVTQVEGHIRQGDSVLLAGLASFGKGRESNIGVATDRAPAFKLPDECEALPYIPGVVPEFTQKFDYRIARGQLPFSGSSDTHLGGWVRFKDGSDSEVTVAHLLALIDAWPPAILPMLTVPAPASSLTWTVEFIEPLPQFGGDSWWQYLAEVEQAADGYGVIQARLWDVEGTLVAFTRQTVTVFD